MFYSEQLLCLKFSGPLINIEAFEIDFELEDLGITN